MPSNWRLKLVSNHFTRKKIGGEGGENNLFSQFVHRKGKKKKKKMSNLGTYTLREIWVNINAALRAYLVQKYYSILRRQRLPPSNRFKKLLVEVVGQITPAEPYKSTALTIFEITLPLLGVITLLSVLPNTYVTLATRRYYLHLENVLHVQKYTDLRNEYIYIYAVL